MTRICPVRAGSIARIHAESSGQMPEASVVAMADAVRFSEAIVATGL